jgi:hypothetical protein
MGERKAFTSLCVSFYQEKYASGSTTGYTPAEQHS